MNNWTISTLFCWDVDLLNFVKNISMPTPILPQFGDVAYLVSLVVPRTDMSRVPANIGL